MEEWNSKYQEFVLKGELIDQYALECLNGGNTLARELLRVKNIKSAEKTTLLPSEFDPQSIEKYSYGGVFERNEAVPMEKIEEIRKEMNLGPSAVIEAVEDGPSKKWLIDKLVEYLGTDKDRLVIFENAIAEPLAPYIQKDLTNVYFFEEEVYHALGAEDSSDKKHIEKVIRRAESYMLVGAMSFVPDKESILTKQLSLETIKAIAENTMAVISRAFDGEGYVICTLGGE